MSTTKPHGLHLHFDCASGIAGDMTLGALLDLGVPEAVVRQALDQVGAGGHRLRAVRCVRGSVAAVDVTVSTEGALLGLEDDGQAHGDAQTQAHGHAHGHAHDHDHDHGDAHQHDHAHRHAHGDAHDHDHGHAHAHARAQDHAHGHDHGDAHDHDHAHGIYDHGHGHASSHGHRHVHVPYRAIRRRVSGSELPADVKALALDIFDRLARAEAKLHGTSVDDVQLHEVGAIDSVVDIVGTAAAWCHLRPVSASCAAVAMGHGTLRCAHGVLPVPAPASLEILRAAGAIMTDGDCARELCTPTGAAILAATVTRWGPMPTGRAIAVGWGAGDLELADRPNVLRLTALEPLATAPAPAPQPPDAPLALALTDEVWQLEANLDDMSPELCNVALEAAFAAGALDVWWTPITMKKGRPALWLCALVADGHRAAVLRAILRETTTIGVRCSRRARTVLARRIETVDTRFGALPMKVAYAGDEVLNAAPEFEACHQAARLHQVPVKEVMAEAVATWTHRARGPVLG